MTLCACREGIEGLRKDMELTFEKRQSFTDPSVLAASQKLDDALVQYRKCPNFELCNSHGASYKKEAGMDKQVTLNKRIAG